MSKIPTWILSVFIILLWGLTFPALKLQLHYMPALVLAAWRVLSSGVVVCLWALALKRPRPSRRLWMQAAVSALLNVVMLYGGQISASVYLAPGEVAGLLYLQPVLVAAFARLWLGEALSVAKLLGVAAGLAGVGLIAFSAGGRTSVLGTVLAISAAVGWALGTVYVKAHPSDSPLWFVGLQFLMGGSAFTVVSLLVPTPTVHWTLLAASDLLFIVLGGTAGAWILWLLLLSRGQASRVSTFLFGVPVVASLVGILAFGEPLSARFIAGFAAVAVGIWLVSARFARSHTSPP